MFELLANSGAAQNADLIKMAIIDNSLDQCLLQLPALNLSNTALIECKLYTGCNSSGIAKLCHSSRVAIGQILPSSATVPELQ